MQKSPSYILPPIVTSPSLSILTPQSSGIQSKIPVFSDLRDLSLSPAGYARVKSSSPFLNRMPKFDRLDDPVRFGELTWLMDLWLTLILPDFVALHCLVYSAILVESLYNISEISTHVISLQLLFQPLMTLRISSLHRISDPVVPSGYHM